MYPKSNYKKILKAERDRKVMTFVTEWATAIVGGAVLLAGLYVLGLLFLALSL